VSPERKHTCVDLARPIDGILLIDKPPGISSAAAVSLVKRALRGAKVGHLGTLDPFASGLLPLCIGEGTKVAPYLNTADKAYTGIVHLGVTSDTLDSTGTVMSRSAPPSLSAEDLCDVTRAFSGAIDQVPPAFSAIKRDGIRMYERARRGEVPDLEPRRVVVHELEIEQLDDERLRITLSCSKGTYVRSLARDIGERLGCGALLESLTRTRFGPFLLERALSPAAIQAGDAAEVLRTAVIPPGVAIAHLRTLRVDRATADRLRAGQQAALTALERPDIAGERARVLGPDEALVAVVNESDRHWRIERVFRALASCAP
jgi:tRNA pseudouridine55 synthase